ncbi:GIY-YIG nuclease family protein [Pontibacter roseus]|uniref:hypothetical protein n=1 Tax=Pontibacter roseus TaxID=336989 RepID=UPI000381FF6F|nr:hypothetical protein [Pontibacter roseus]
MERLTQLGFNPIGKWFLINEHYLQFSFLNESWREKNALYSFIIDNEIKYIGLSPTTLGSQMYKYKRPDLTQIINVEIRSLIVESLEQNIPVSILSYPDNRLLNYAGYNISLTAGIKGSLINELQPSWNFIDENALAPNMNFEAHRD